MSSPNNNSVTNVTDFVTRFEVWVDKSTETAVGLVYIHNMKQQGTTKFQLRGTKDFCVNYVQVIDPKSAAKLESKFECNLVQADDFSNLVSKHKFEVQKQRTVQMTFLGPIDSGWTAI